MRGKIPQIKNKGWCGPKDLDVKFSNILYIIYYTYNSRPENLNYRSKNVVSLISCKTCDKKYTGSSEEFRTRFNNYRCAHCNYAIAKT